MINLLIKMADSLDKRGLHKEASKVDELIKKIAMDLENDYLEGIREYSEDEEDEGTLDLKYDQMVEERDRDSEAPRSGG